MFLSGLNFGTMCNTHYIGVVRVLQQALVAAMESWETQ